MIFTVSEIVIEVYLLKHFIFIKNVYFFQKYLLLLRFSYLIILLFLLLILNYNINFIFIEN